MALQAASRYNSSLSFKDMTLTMPAVPPCSSTTIAICACSRCRVASTVSSEAVLRVTQRIPAGSHGSAVAAGEAARTLNAAAQRALASEIENRATRVHEAVDSAFALANTPARESDVALGYVTTFLDGALALQANAAYQVNAAGTKGQTAVTGVARAKLNF